MSSRIGVIVVDLVLLAFLVGLILGFFAGQVAAASRPAPVIPAATAWGPSQPDQGRTEPPRSLVAPPPRTAAPVPSAPRLEGIRATWYCNADRWRGPLSPCTAGHPDVAGDQLFAAVTPDLARLRGHRVEVCRGQRCVTVRVIDCDCRTTRSIDLYADAAARLGILQLGWGWVSLKVVGG